MILANQSGRSRSAFVFMIQTLAILALILSAASVPLHAQKMCIRDRITRPTYDYAEWHPFSA